MLSHKMDFNCCANRDGFRIDSHIYPCGSHVFYDCTCINSTFIVTALLLTVSLDK